MSPVLFIPGLLCSAEVFGPQVNALWRFGPVMVASTLEASTIGDAAAKILERAPPRFALAGLSMGGYVALEIVRQAPDRVARLALLDTGARDDPPAAQETRRSRIALGSDQPAQRKCGGDLRAVEQRQPLFRTKRHR